MRSKLTKNGRIGLEILLTALAAGVAGDSLLRSMPWGLNLPLMAATGIAALLFLKYRSGAEFFSVKDLVLLASALFFSSWFAIRDSEPLLFLNLLAILLIGSILMLPKLRLSMQGAGIVHYAASGISLGLSVVFMPLQVPG